MKGLCELCNTLTELMTNALKYQKAMKPQVIEGINVRGFVATCLATGRLGKFDNYLKGYRLEEYLLDPRFSVFVLPRGIYPDENTLALNLSVYSKESELDGIVSPGDFKVVESEILSNLRLSDGITTNLLEVSKSINLSDAVKRLQFDDRVHDSGEFVLPLALDFQCHRDVYYSLGFDEYMKIFFTDWFNSFCKSN